MKGLAKIREKLIFDVAIVGAGVSGLTAGIRLKQLCPSLEVCILEKSSSVGDHIVSGCLFNPRALNELLPSWQIQNLPLGTKVQSVKNLYLTKSRAFTIPQAFTPWSQYSQDYILSLGDFCKWLKTLAESLDVRVFENFTAKEILTNNLGFVEGVATGPVGLDRGFEKKEFFQDSVEVIAQQTIFADGADGVLTRELRKKFKLDGLQNLLYEAHPQTHSLGLKEVWETSGNSPGQVVHTFSWPMNKARFRGFLYTTPIHTHVGIIAGLDYSNPYIDLFEELQKFKTHPYIKKYLEKGRPIEFSSKTIEDGGFFSVPKLSFPGGLIIGASGGFCNPLSYQGVHLSMKSAMIAAESICEKGQKTALSSVEIKTYYEKYIKSWAYDELFKYRHIRQAFNSSPLFGLLYSFKNRKSLTEKSVFYIENSRKGENFSERECTESSFKHKRPEYVQKDKKITFDKKDTFDLANMIWKDQPEFIHLRYGNEQNALYSIKAYDGIEERICPTGVFKYRDSKLYIESHKCILCGACRLKSTRDIIEWSLPEAGTGPK